MWNCWNGLKNWICSFKKKKSLVKYKWSVNGYSIWVDVRQVCQGILWTGLLVRWSSLGCTWRWILRNRTWEILKFGYPYMIWPHVQHFFSHFEVFPHGPEGEEGCAVVHHPCVFAEVIYGTLWSLKLHSWFTCHELLSDSFSAGPVQNPFLWTEILV